MIGSVVAGKYMIQRRLGAGGMGTVYQALHTATNRCVALKVLHERFADEDSSDFSGGESLDRKRETAVARFEREARSATRVHSPHVVEVLDAGDDEGSPYIAMELLQGMSVKQLCNRVDGPIRMDTALRIVAQACAGLVAAHDARIVHRDIKPENLFLSKDRNDGIVVKVVDFGIAKIKEDRLTSTEESALTQTGHVVGSPRYMSPEQSIGLKTVDHRTDLWSLGVVLYRLVSARTPYEERNTAQIILAIHSKPPTPIAEYAPWTRPEVRDIIRRALQHHPAQRYQTASEMLHDLDALLPNGRALTEDMLTGASNEELETVVPPEDQPIDVSPERDVQALPGPSAAPAPVPGRRRRTVAIVVSLLLLALLLAAGWFALRPRLFS